MTRARVSSCVSLTLPLLSLALATLIALPAHAQAAQGKEPLSIMLREATGLFEEGSYVKALPALRKILRIDPGNKTALRYLLIYDIEIKEPYCRAAAAAFFDRDYKTAAAKWEEVLKHDPGDNRVKQMINEALLLSNRGAIVTLYASATRLIDAGKYNEAAHELGKILEIEPGETKASRLLESIRASMEDSAINSLYSTASELKARGEYDLAVDALNRVLKLDPSQELASRLIESVMKSKYEATYKKARLLYREGEYIKARDQFSKLTLDHRKNKELSDEIDRLKETISLISKANARGSVWKAVRISLFNYISPDGSPELAVVAAQHALELSSGDAAARTVKKFMDSRLGKWKPQKQEHGKGPGVLDRYMVSALNNIYEGHYGRAVEECSIVLAIEEENPLALKRLGSAFYLMGDKERALATWQKAKELAPEDSELGEFLDMVLGRRG